MSIFNKENVLSYFLAFVVMYFGANEIFAPEKWLSFVPAVFGTGNAVSYLVVIHGVVLFASGLALIFNFFRRGAAVVVFLMLLDVLYSVYSGSGFSPIFVRDVGLAGMALALSLRN